MSELIRLGAINKKRINIQTHHTQINRMSLYVLIVETMLLFVKEK